MIKTDYSKIADRYDNNKLRHDIPKDDLINDIYLGNNKSISILDLACGTGNYIETQQKYYSNFDIKWYGLDLSQDMLNKANEKNLKAKLILGDVTNLPFANETFDYIKLRFAFHHFQNKERALAEMKRVLKYNGILSIHNLCHDYMKSSWVYKYFPSSIEVDKDRFVDTKDLYKMLSDYEFAIDAKVEVIIKKYLYKEIISEVKNKDMSQLNIISDIEYYRGLNDIINDSGANDYIIGDIAFMNFICTKK
jgi:ubiquinone/menaquinone biosynthesis C-methylase UbiE